MEISPKIERNLCADDPIYFIEKYCRIINKLTGETIPFLLYDCQKPIVEALRDAHFDREKAPLHHIILKARQMGYTWLVSAFALWKATFNKNEHIVLLSEKEDLAKEMMGRIEFMYANLPEFLQSPLFNNNREEIHFGVRMRSGMMNMEKSLNSKIQCIPTTETGVQSKTLTMFVMDEGASVKYAKSIWYRSAMPALEAAKGIGVIIGTAKPLHHANGAGKWFRDMYLNAKAVRNKLIPHFFGWMEVPGRTLEWWNEQIEEMGETIGLQEYPSVDTDAFQATGRQIFDLGVLEKRRELIIKEKIKVERFHYDGKREHADSNGKIHIWKHPEERRTYSIGVDSSSGIGLDATCITVIDDSNYEQVCEVYGKIRPVETAHIANWLGKYYNDALIVVEIELHGTKVQDVLYEELGYPYLYIRRTLNRITNEWEQNLGWKTTRTTRPKLVDDIRHAVNSKLIKLNSMGTIAEMLEFEEDENGKADHPVGGSSDRIFAIALAFQGTLYGQGSDVPAPSDAKETPEYKNFKEYVEAFDKDTDDWKYL